MFKTYGLTGQTVKIKLVDKSLKEAYPWNDTEVPVKITAEYPKFLVGTVLPHMNHKGFGNSRPYTVTIPKFDIQRGAFILTTIK